MSFLAALLIFCATISVCILIPEHESVVDLLICYTILVCMTLGVDFDRGRVDSGPWRADLGLTWADLGLIWADLG